MEFPQGVSTISPPPLLLSSEMFSPNCWFLLSSSKQPGIKIEKYYSKAITYAGIASVIAIIQIFSLIHQMEHTPTPSVSSDFLFLIFSNLNYEYIRAYQMFLTGQLLCKPLWMGINVCCI